MDELRSPAQDGSAFPPTEWTVVADSVSSNPARAREAMEALCQNYREPIVNWFKRKDFRQDPEDLAQGFFAFLIGKGLLLKVAPRTGRFRCFLVAVMHNYLRDSWDLTTAQKRGGGLEKVPLWEVEGELPGSLEGETPLDVDFAQVIHRKVMARLAPREGLKAYLFYKESAEGWDEVAERLGTTAAAIRKEVSRLRRSHWELFSAEVAQIASPADRAEETKYLYELLFRNQPSA